MHAVRQVTDQVSVLPGPDGGHGNGAVYAVKARHGLRRAAERPFAQQCLVWRALGGALGRAA
jgi:hypothetical protein